MSGAVEASDVQTHVTQKLRYRQIPVIIIILLFVKIKAIHLEHESNN